MTVKKGKGTFDDEKRILAVIIMCAVSFTIVITAGLIIEKRAVPEKSVSVIAVVEDDGDSGQADENAADNSEDTFYTEAPMGKVNINEAGKDELMRLEGIGSATADAIIEYRSKKRFEDIGEIMEVSGIGEKKFENIKDDICV